MPFARTSGSSVCAASPAPRQLSSSTGFAGDSAAVTLGRLARPFDRDRLRAFDALVGRQVENETCSHAADGSLMRTRLRPVSSDNRQREFDRDLPLPAPAQKQRRQRRRVRRWRGFSLNARRLRNALRHQRRLAIHAHRADGRAVEIQRHLRPLVREHLHRQRRRDLHDLSREPRLILRRRERRAARRDGRWLLLDRRVAQQRLVLLAREDDGVRIFREDVFQRVRRHPDLALVGLRWRAAQRCGATAMPAHAKSTGSQQCIRREAGRNDRQHGHSERAPRGRGRAARSEEVTDSTRAETAAVDESALPEGRRVSRGGGFAARRCATGGIGGAAAAGTAGEAGLRAKTRATRSGKARSHFHVPHTNQTSAERNTPRVNRLPEPGSARIHRSGDDQRAEADEREIGKAASGARRPSRRSAAEEREQAGDAPRRSPRRSCRDRRRGFPPGASSRRSVTRDAFLLNLRVEAGGLHRRAARAVRCASRAVAAR